MNPVFQATPEYIAQCGPDQEDWYHFIPDKWYFWDETWSDTCGPYDSESQAIAALDQYIKTALAPRKEGKNA